MTKERTDNIVSGAGTAGMAGALTIATLGLLAVGNEVAARRAVARNQPEGRFIEVDGVRLHYRDAGSGPDVVLVHGNGALIQDWLLSGLAGMLSRHHRVIIFDRPGYGHSDRPRNRVWTPEAQAQLLLKAMDALNIDQPVVIGHSWGAMIAAAMAVHDQSRLRGLVLLSGYYMPTARLDVPMMSGPAIPLLGDVVNRTIQPLLARMIVKRLFKRLFDPLPLPDSYQRWPRELLLRPSQLRASAAETMLMIPAAARLRPTYGGIRIPVTIMAGTEDKIADFGRQSEALHREIPHSRLIPIEQVGHMIHYAVPDRITTEVERLTLG